MERHKVKVIVDTPVKSTSLLRLTFDIALTRVDFALANVPSTDESQRIERFCQPVVQEIMKNWKETDALNGVFAISVNRHIIELKLADSRLFSWDPIIASVGVVIREAITDRGVEFLACNGDEEKLVPYKVPETADVALARAIFESTCVDSEKNPIPVKERVT